jgi:hypothetical protein
LASCWALLVVPGWSGDARIAEASGSERVVIATTDASVDEILSVLAAHFEFAVERGARPGETVRFSGALHGSLGQLLARLLRHEEHIIVRSAEARAGVSRVVLLEAKGVPPAPTAQESLAALSAGFPLKAKQQLPQLWGGLE